VRLSTAVLNAASTAAVISLSACASASQSGSLGLPSAIVQLFGGTAREDLARFAPKVRESL
jgi:hypothetical protein